MWPAGHQFDTCVLQHAAAQQCLLKALEMLSLCQSKKNLQYEGNSYLQKIFRSCKKIDKKDKKANRSRFRALLALCTSWLPR